MKSFRDPITNVLTAWGHVDGNGSDLARDEPEDFALEPGKWVLVGDTWQPYENKRADIQAQIDQIERSTMMNRGSREGWLQVIRDKAESLGITDDATIAAENPFFARLLEVDNQIRALRDQL